MKKGGYYDKDRAFSCSPCPHPQQRFAELVGKMQPRPAAPIVVKKAIRDSGRLFGSKKQPSRPMSTQYYGLPKRRSLLLQNRRQSDWR
ncbi:TPA: hypothetical protein R4X15_000686 [Citrobacter amalonaticus]|nr:hypothetical protein [Citrobacter amalonaticus]